MSRTEVEVRLRAENQITLPDEVARQLRLSPGDRLLLTINSDDHDAVSLRPIRRSYAGALAGVYDAPDEVAQYLSNERLSWDQ